MNFGLLCGFLYFGFVFFAWVEACTLTRLAQAGVVSILQFSKPQLNLVHLLDARQ